MNMLENAQVLDRQWPAPKSLTREAEADELTRDNLYRQPNWLREETDDNLRDMVGQITVLAFREPGLSDAERMIEVKAVLTEFCELWAESRVEECE